ncbi:hypothetical protein OHB07_12245 [Streptomyces sp. NBC_00111]|nr:hypothetical protein [Streptomyces sp. NBC_01460]
MGLLPPRHPVGAGPRPVTYAPSGEESRQGLERLPASALAGEPSPA